MRTIWKKTDFKREEFDEFYRATGGKLTPITLRVLLNRNINTVDKAREFFRGGIGNLHDPYLMKDMDKGIKIMCDSIRNGEKIMIYGDYDADGVTSTVILYKALKRCGANVSYHIPHRENEGYGMSMERIEIIAEEGYDLIISCDNGISAINEVKRAKELGLKVIVTDHHELPFKEDENGNRQLLTPDSDALINPKQEDCNYPFKLLCGAGIAYKYSLALIKAMGIEDSDTSDLLELAAIGTICDVVDLTDENRIIAKEGLRLLSHTKNKGINILKSLLGIEGEVSCYNVGFNIGPCINATGRLETAELSVRLLLTEDDREARELATEIFNLNKERQELTNVSVERVCEEIENGPYKDDRVLVLYDGEIHESIAGIVAGRVREKYGKPTFILTKGKDMPKGSGRSIDEYNMFEEMLKCRDLLHKFGGHPLAAGLSIEEENIEPFRRMLNKNCRLTEEDLAIKVRVDSPIKLNYVNEMVVNEFKKLEPFGKGNPSPVLMSPGVKVNSVRFLGSEEQHVKFSFRLQGTNTFMDGIFFNGRDEVIEVMEGLYGINYRSYMNMPSDMYIDILFQPDINEYMGRRSVQLKIRDIRISR